MQRIWSIKSKFRRVQESLHRFRSSSNNHSSCVHVIYIIHVDVPFTSCTVSITTCASMMVCISMTIRMSTTTFSFMMSYLVNGSFYCHRVIFHPGFGFSKVYHTCNVQNKPILYVHAISFLSVRTEVIDLAAGLFSTYCRTSLQPKAIISQSGNQGLNLSWKNGHGIWKLCHSCDRHTADRHYKLPVTTTRF